MEGSPAASPRVCSPPSCAVQGGMRLSQVTAGDLAVLPRGDPGLEQPQLSLGVQGSCRAAFLLSLSCIFLAMLLGRRESRYYFFMKKVHLQLQGVQETAMTPCMHSGLAGLPGLELRPALVSLGPWLCTCQGDSEELEVTNTALMALLEG